jgi:hypothetical protein
MNREQAAFAILHHTCMRLKERLPVLQDRGR